MRDEGTFLIGELAQRVGVNRETLRYYERRGILVPAGRTGSGYRVYDCESEARLGFIKRAQGFGFSLDEIGGLLEMQPENPHSCGRVVKMLDDKLEELSARIREMKGFHRQLAGYRGRCGKALAEGECCPVIVTVAGSDARQRK